MLNACIFSTDRRHRYTLLHRWDAAATEPLFHPPAAPHTTAHTATAVPAHAASTTTELVLPPGPGIAWICLNPSTADEHQLDPTLRRIRGFSDAWGYHYFLMLNAFAWRDTDPAGLRTAPDPVGPDNDRWIAHVLARMDRVMVAWGNDGAFLARDRAVRALLDPARTFSLGFTQSGQPRHPLYVSARTAPVPFFAPKTVPSSDKAN